MNKVCFYHRKWIKFEIHCDLMHCHFWSNYTVIKLSQAKKNILQL